MAILLGLGSAVFFALSSAMEQHAAKQERPTRTLDPRLLVRLLRRPLWLFGWVPDAIGTVLQAIALRFGALALVEPLLLSGVFMAIPLEAALERRRPHRKDLVVVAIGVIGLTAFLTAGRPSHGVAVPSTSAWLGVAAGVGLVFAACLVAAWRLQDARRGIMLGLATGLLYAVAAALLKVVTTELSSEGLRGIFGNWHLYALLVVGAGALTLNQNAYQGGPIAAPLTTIALVDPVTSVVIGVTAFHEQLATDGPRLLIQVVSALVMVVVLALASTTRSQ
ncbi:DMT family transporter [Micromonospora sp. NPDC049559]|uniref:DMT family transporter n=1 Tax=Micromonospora sp. NPDC049559 TaxID=3155923 RepID=UPI003428AC72